MSTEQALLDAIAAAVRSGSEEDTVSLSEQALGEGGEPREIIKGGLCRGMHEAGELYERNEYFLPELLLASEAMHAGIDALVPAMRAEGETVERETVVLGVVEGDVHEIGKNLVAVMLEAEGYKVIDLGYDVSPQRFMESIDSSGARVLALSTMMTTTLPAMRMTAEIARGSHPGLLVVVGGAPLSSAVAADMGADGYEDNAAKVPALIRSLLG